MGRKVSAEKVVREAGYLYYIGKDGFVWKSAMKNGDKKGKAKVGVEKIDKKAGCLYYLGKDGFVYEAKLKNTQ